MKRPLTTLGVALLFGLVGCGSDDGPTAPSRPETYQLHVTGEWPRAREAAFEDATWEVWWFRDYPPGGMCSPGPCGEHVTVATGPIGRDGYFEGYSPEVECRDYRISLSGRYAQNRESCTASSQAVACSSVAQNFSEWQDWEFGSCVDGGEEPIPTFHLNVTISWDMSQDDGFNPGDWSLHQWSVDGFGSWYELDGGTIPSTGQFRVQTLVSCLDTLPVDYQLRLELSGRYPGGASCNLFVMPDCADTAQEIQIGPPADVCS